MNETQVHSRNMVRFAADKENVVVLSGDLTGSTEISQFKKELPDKFFSLGMAEQNMLSWAGGMAREGIEPYLHTFAVFLVRRPYDQLAMSVAYPNQRVRLVGFLPGIMTPGGVSHQALEDVSLMRGLPNMTVLETGDVADVESVLDVAHAVDGPVYIRMLRGSIPRLFDTPMEFNRVRHVHDGEDITIFSAGITTEEVMKATRALEAQGVTVTHRHVTTHKPFSDPAVDDAIRAASRRVFTVENHSIIGGLGTEVAERMAEIGAAVPLTRIGVGDTFAHGASAPYLMDKYGLSAPRIVERIGRELDLDLVYQEEAPLEQGAAEVGAEQLEAM